MASYFGRGSDTLHATTDKTMINLHATTGVRPKVFHMIISCSATPADSAAHFLANRTTTKGTGGTEVTAVPALEGAERASIGTYTPGAFSAEPTYTAGALLFSCSVYQRHPFQFYANGQAGRLIAPATANNGIGVKSEESNAGTASTLASCQWIE